MYVELGCTLVSSSEEASGLPLRVWFPLRRSPFLFLNIIANKTIPPQNNLFQKGMKSCVGGEKLVINFSLRNKMGR